MAFWDKISSRGNVEDRRGSSGGLLIGGGGLGITGIIITLLINYLGGGDLSGSLNQLQNIQVPTEQVNSRSFEGSDDYEVFVSTVLGSTNDMWSQVFGQNNMTYRQPKLVLFRSATESSCGFATASIGPHYCPADETIYIDETFFDELQKRFKAQGGDVAEAYVIAHEVGHHAQKLLGIMDQVQEESRSSEATANELSIKQELQADCFAGLWAHSIRDKGVFENPGEINEALDAASAVGDDRIQTATEGRIRPENWTHGSSEQRSSWFNRGYETGSVQSCNTF
jgi:uncharacterized protein